MIITVMRKWGSVCGAGLLLIGAIALDSSASSGNSPGRASFPRTPDLKLTPGSLCDRPTQKRYAEGIPYCARDVESELKKEVMRQYDRELGYRVTQMDRQEFKIDHFIPLCMGGSNEADNLWPQHESVYVLTDQLEHLACEKMSQGRLRQADAVAWIQEAKRNLSLVSIVLKRIQSL